MGWQHDIDMTVWDVEPTPHPEALHTPGAGPDWHAWNEWAPEVEVADFTAELAALVDPDVIIETGVSQGFITRRLAAAAPQAELLLYEADPTVRSRLPINVQPAATYTAEDAAAADLLVLDSHWPERVRELQTWVEHGRAGSWLFMHDVNPTHPEGSGHRLLWDLVEQLDIPHMLFHNPRGSILLYRPDQWQPPTGLYWPTLQTVDPTPRTAEVTVGYVTAGHVRVEFASTLHQAINACQQAGITVRQQPHVAGPRIAASRNHIVETFLASGSEWLFMVDTDMVLEADTLLRLLAVADPDTVPVVGALTWGKGRDGLFPTIYRWSGSGMVRAEGWDDNILHPVDATGAACLLVHRTVFQRVAEHFKPPWVWFQETTLPGGTQEVGEDITFCMRVRSLDIPIFVHTGIQLGHVKEFTIDRGFYEAWCQSHRVIVTGTGRSGTKWISAILQTVKVPADHERMFNPDWHDIPPWGRADVSWLAAPHLPRYPDAFTLHIVRNPIDVVNSYVDLGFFDDQPPETSTRYVDYIRRWLPDLWAEPDPTARAVRFYVEWNRMIEPYAIQRLRLEDQITGGNLLPAVHAAGNLHQAWEISQAIAQTPMMNVRADPANPHTWDTLAAGDWTDQLKVMAESYGYGG